MRRLGLTLVATTVAVTPCRLRQIVDRPAG